MSFNERIFISAPAGSRADLLKLQGEYQMRLRILEQSLLRALSDATGNILENTRHAASFIVPNNREE